MRKKLIGIHNSEIMIEELEDTKHRKEVYYPMIRQAILGEKDRLRYKHQKKD